MRRLVFVCLLSVLSCSLWAADDAAFFDRQASLESQLQNYVDAEGLDKLAGVKRVLVSQFRIEFQLRTEAGGHATTGTNTSVYLHLKGVDDALLQKITDKAYQDFLKRMQAAGIEVIGPDKLASEPEFSAIEKLGKPSPAVLETKDGISHFFAPGGGKVYTLLRASDKDRQGFGSGLSTGFEDMMREMPKAELALSKKYKAPCVKVLLSIAPGQAEVSGWKKAGIIGDAVTLIGGSSSVLPALTMMEESRLVARSAEHSASDSKMFGGSRFFGQKVRDFSQEGDSAIFLKKPLLVADPISNKKMEETTGLGSQAMNATATVGKAANVAGMLGALGGFVPFGGALAPAAQVAQVANVTGKHEHREYTIEAAPELFETAASDEIASTLGLFLAKLLAGTK